MLMEQNRKEWVDFGKGIAMFLVFIYHSESLYDKSPSLSYWFLFFRMPFFIFLSGYLFSSNWESFTVKRKFKQIFRGILWPYFLFTLAMCYPKAFMNGTTIEQGLVDIMLGWASWFVIALAVVQTLMTLILSKIKQVNGFVVLLIIFAGIGWGNSLIFEDRLPFNLQNVGIVSFYFALGLLYRKYELILKYFLTKKNLLAMFLLYLGMLMFDYNFIHTTGDISANHYSNFWLYVFYTLFGIITVLLFVNLHKCPRVFSFIGANSLIFYFLNGGVLKIVSLMIHKLHIVLPLSIEIVLVAIIACLLVIPIVLIINKFFPLVLGKKEAFNKMMKILHLPATY